MSCLKLPCPETEDNSGLDCMIGSSITPEAKIQAFQLEMLGVQPGCIQSKCSTKELSRFLSLSPPPPSTPNGSSSLESQAEKPLPGLQPEMLFLTGVSGD